MLQPLTTRLLRLAGFISVCFIFVLQLVPVRAAVITVNTLAGDNDGFCNGVEAPSDCSLAEAISLANASAGADTIVFDITVPAPQVPPYTIVLDYALPALTDNNTTIDGISGTGGFCDKPPIPVVEIQGQNLASGAVLTVNSNHNVIRGLIINNTPNTGFQGISITGDGNLVECNYLGTDTTGNFSDSTLVNYIGVMLDTANNNTVLNNVIVSRSNGVSLVSGTGNKIQGNYIGLNFDGTNRIPIGGFGIRVGVNLNAAATGNIIGTDGDGTDDDLEGNVISGNTSSGIQLLGATNNVIAGNYIGTTAFGDAPTTGNVTSNGTGIVLRSAASGNRIGGTNPDERNVISGNSIIGVGILDANTNNNTLQGNYIGLAENGTDAVPNTSGGVRINTAGNTISDMNIIAGNGVYGVRVDTTSGTTTIQDNYIGTDASGGAAVSNPIGVDVVTGSVTLTNNVISGNTTSGVNLAGTGSNTVSDNFIGSDVGGTFGVPNGTGVNIDSSNNTLTNNTIAFNTGVGVRITNGGIFGNNIASNRYQENGQLGIDLGGVGVNPNDAGDGDTGANNLQNYPVLAYGDSFNSLIRYSFNSIASSDFTLEFYVCDATPQEGMTSLGTEFVTTDASGNITNADFNVSLTSGDFVTATATDTFGNTSEFAPCVEVIDPPIFIFTPAPPTLPDAYTNTPYNQTISATAATGTLPYTYTATGLPAWLSLATDGTLSGTPPATPQVPVTFTVTVTDALGFFEDVTYSLEVVAPPVITLTPLTLPNAGEGLAYNQVITASGGAEPYTFTITAGDVTTQGLAGTGTPPASYTISGPATSAGTTSFTLRATDAGGFFVEQAYTINVIAAPTINFSQTTLPDTIQNLPAGYSHTITASGGTPNYTFSVTPADLTALNALGLTVDFAANQATIRGSGAGNTVTGTGTVSFTLTVTDNLGFTANQNYTINIAPEPVVAFSPTTLPDTIESLAYNQVVNMTGGTAPYTFSIANGTNVGQGLTFTGAASSFTITGPTTGSGFVSFTVIATDSNGFQATQNYTLNVAPAPTITLTGALMDTYVGAVYNQVLTAGGGTAPYTFNVTGLPANGLTATPAANTLTVAGSPTATGVLNVSVQVLDANGFQTTQNYVINIAGVPTLNFNPAAIANMIQNRPTPYTIDIDITGGTAPYTFNITGGALPTGVIGTPLDADTFRVTGTPTVTGTFTFDLEATDSTVVPAPIVTTRTYTFDVTAEPTFVFSPAALGNLYQNKPGGYNLPITVTPTNGTAPYTFSISAGALPAGITGTGVGSTYTLTGTPTVTGAYNFTLQITDANGFVATQNYTGNIQPQPTITLTPPTLPNRIPGVPYTPTLVATGGTGPYTYQIVAGEASLTALGLALDTNTGSFTGTPSAGTATFQAQARDADGFTSAVVNYSFTLQALALSVTTLPAGTVGTDYAPVVVNVTGGDGDYTITVPTPPDAASNLVVTPGATSFTIDDVGGLGTPNTYNFTVNIDDGNGGVINQNYSMTINPVTVSLQVQLDATAQGGGITTVTGTSLTVAANYQMPEIVFSALGGINPHRITSIDGIPVDGAWGTVAGINITGLGTNNARLTGIPTAPGTYTFDVIGEDNIGNTVTVTYTLEVLPVLLIVVTGNNLGGTIGVPYGGFFTASGGIAPYTFSLVGGTMPAGLTLNADGTVTGTPTNAETQSITVRATDFVGNTRNRTFTITIGLPTITLAPTTVPDGVLNTAYTQTIVASGSAGPFSYSVISGSLPPGLSLNATTGVLSGTPTTLGGFAFTIEAVDVNNTNIRGQAPYGIDIVEAADLVVSPATLPDPIEGFNYTQTFTATGGTAPYTFTISGGTVPGGLSMSTGGVLSGIPTTLGFFSFTVRAQDSSATPLAGTRSYTIQVIAGNAPGYGSDPAPGSEISFGIVSAGNTVTRTITVRETGASALNVSNPIFGGPHAADFRFVTGSPPFTINDGGSPVAMTIGCTPSNSLEARFGTLTLTTNDPTRPTVVYNLKCNSTTPPISGTVTPGGQQVPPTGIAPGVTVVTILDVDDPGAVGGQPATIANVTFVKGLALRTGPYLGASMLGVVRPDKDYPVLAQNPGDGEGNFNWYLIVDADNDRVGWASGRYLKLKGDVNVPFTTTIFDEIDGTPDKGARVYIRGNVNVRVRPSLRSDELLVTPYGTELVVLGRTMQAGIIQWLHVIYTAPDGRQTIGWIFYNYYEDLDPKLIEPSPLPGQVEAVDLTVVPVR